MRLAERQEQQIVVKLGEIEIADDASSITVGPGGEGGQQFLLDDHATRLLGRYLKIPRPYLLGLDKAFRAQVLKHHRDRHPEADTMIEVLGDSLVSVHAPHLLMLPLDRVADIIERLVGPQADVRTFLRDENHFHVDVTTDLRSIEVPTDTGTDTVVGGVRMLAYPHQVKPPVVTPYLHHVHTGGGMVTDMAEGRIRLKGRSLQEVLEEMEIAGETALAKMPEHLAAFAATRQLAVPGSPLAFATQLLREAGLPVKVRDAVTDLVNQLPEDASVYDVTCALVSVANRVSYASALKLQQLGGQLALQAEQTVRRCSQCEQLLLT